MDCQPPLVSKNYFYQCPDLSSMPNLERLSSLRNPSLDSCNTLEVLPIAGRCSSLEMRWISECVTLNKIRDRLSTATYLEELAINSCPNLTLIANLEVFSHLQKIISSFMHQIGDISTWSTIVMS
ncbi:hypothetical protein GQ457_14G005260 [Hibiscus cannabinus]